MKARLAICIVAASAATAALAENVQIMVNYQTVVGSSDGQARLDKSVKLFFGHDGVPAGAKSLGVVTVNKISKTHERHDFAANCNDAVIDALTELQEKARSAGGNAVGNIGSEYKGIATSAADQAECHAGGTGGHLTLKAELFKLN